MTTVKSIPGLLRKLADTIERAMGVKADEDSDRRRAQIQRNAEAIAAALAAADADLRQKRQERRQQRRKESEDVVAACLAAGLLSKCLLHVSGNACAKAIQNTGHFISELFVVNQVVEGVARGVDAIELAAVAGGLVISSQSKTESLAYDIERVVTKSGVVICWHGQPSNGLNS